MTYPTDTATPTQQAQPRNAFGVTSLVLGVLAVLLSWIPLVGVVGWPLSILGLVFGGLGLNAARRGHGRKGLTVAGVVLSLVGLLICILWTVAIANQAGKATTPGTVSGVPVVSVPEVPAAQSAALGQTYTYPDGLAVSISAGNAFNPGQYYPTIGRGLTLNVTVTNGTTEAFAVNSILNGPMATVGGVPAQLIVNPDDPAAGAGMASSTVLPGKSFTYHPSIAVAKAPSDLQLEWTRDYASPKAIFTGQG